MTINYYGGNKDDEMGVANVLEREEQPPQGGDI